MPKRLPYEAAVIAAFALGSCDLPRSCRASDAERLDVADANARNAIARVAALESRVSDLEARQDR